MPCSRACAARGLSHVAPSFLYTCGAHEQACMGEAPWQARPRARRIQRGLQAAQRASSLRVSASPPVPPFTPLPSPRPHLILLHALGAHAARATVLLGILAGRQNAPRPLVHRNLEGDLRMGPPEWQPHRCGAASMWQHPCMCHPRTHHAAVVEVERRKHACVRALFGGAQQRACRGWLGCRAWRMPGGAALRAPIAHACGTSKARPPACTAAGTSMTTRAHRAACAAAAAPPGPGRAAARSAVSAQAERASRQRAPARCTPRRRTRPRRPQRPRRRHTPTRH